MASPLLPRPQLSDEVAAHLRESIMSGELRPREFVRLDAVAAELGVSVTPVREALLALRAEGMVELQPRRGFVVTPLTRQDVQDLFSLQAHLASQLMARAAERITEQQLLDLERMAADLAAAAHVGSQSLGAQEYEFHRAINLIAQSRKLARFMELASRYAPGRLYTADEDWRRQVVADHSAILTALREHDAEAARAAILRHAADGEQRLLRHLDSVGIWES
ncbi:GntR family transcriptional regulator [Kutzneria viridogrisea]|uniref:DNA-binding GntR family transcriptional regulator n=1 Tax=Kutzneria viridogrisea TaxID=47990 RepID=A0ABR6BMD7_9PSEU|nr:DNA-binding GntR family transcriptional regulator [Kutzneria viridogrisea]